MPQQNKPRAHGVTKPVFKEPGNKNKFQKMRAEVSRILMRQALTVPNAANRHQQIRRVAPFTASHSANAALMRNATNTVMKRRSNTLILKTSEDPHLVIHALNNGANARVLAKNDIQRRLSGRFLELLKVRPGYSQHRPTESYAAMLVRLLAVTGLPTRPKPANHETNNSKSISHESYEVAVYLTEKYVQNPSPVFLNLLVALHRYGFLPYLHQHVFAWLCVTYALEYRMWTAPIWTRIMKLLTALAPAFSQGEKDTLLYLYLFRAYQFRVNEVEDLVRLGARPTQKALDQMLTVIHENNTIQDRHRELAAIFRQHGVRGFTEAQVHAHGVGGDDLVNKVRQLGLLRH